MKTPLTSEPLWFGHQWCFCGKASTHADFNRFFFWFEIGHNIKKVKMGDIKRKNLVIRTPFASFKSSAKSACLL